MNPEITDQHYDDGALDITLLNYNPKYTVNLARIDAMRTHQAKDGGVTLGEIVEVHSRHYREWIDENGIGLMVFTSRLDDTGVRTQEMKYLIGATLTCIGVLRPVDNTDLE